MTQEAKQGQSGIRLMCQIVGEMEDKHIWPNTQNVEVEI